MQATGIDLPDAELPAPDRMDRMDSGGRLGRTNSAIKPAP
jgi:hypothetical protein